MKKLLIAMLVMVLMLIPFSGCANNSTEDSSTDSVTSDTVTDSTTDSVANVTSNTTNDSTDSSDEEKSLEDLPKGESIFDFITYEDGEYFLTISNTLTKIRITEYMQYIFRLDVEMLKAAETSIIEQLPQEFQSSSSFYLQENEEGYLCLCTEVIVKLEPPDENGYVTGGCGYDHDHLFFKEKLILLED